MSAGEKFTIVGRRPLYTADRIRRKVAALGRRIDFVRVRSYGGGSSPGSRIEVVKDVETDVAGPEAD